SPLVRQGIFAFFSFSHSPLTWLSSKVRNVSPVVDSRSKARYRNVSAACGSAWLHALSMLAFPGVTPPAAFSRNHLPGAVSLFPPLNMLSCACESGELIGLARLCQSRVVGSRCSVQNDCSARLGVAWFPSPPWKLLPGSAQLVAVVSAAALSAR